MWVWECLPFKKAPKLRFTSTVVMVFFILRWGLTMVIKSAKMGKSKVCAPTFTCLGAFRGD